MTTATAASTTRVHRTASLEELYTIPTLAAATAPLLAGWIAAHVERPVVIGPDAESGQWVQRVATHLGAPHVLMSQRRAGDESVAIRLPTSPRVWATIRCWSMTSSRAGPR